MYKLVLALALVASAVADVSHLPSVRAFGHGSPAHPGPQIAILRQSQDILPDGGYKWAYDTENGISAEEQGAVRVVGPEQVDKAAAGGFSWTSPEGEQVSVHYTADENGYHPQGSHIPVAPPVPEAIQRALAWIAAHPQPQEPAKRF